MKCENCGAELENGTVFCGICGKETGKMTQPVAYIPQQQQGSANQTSRQMPVHQSPVQPVQKPNPIPTEKKSGVNMVLVIIIAILAFAVAALAAVIVIDPWDRDNSEQVTTEQIQASKKSKSDKNKSEKEAEDLDKEKTDDDAEDGDGGFADEDNTEVIIVTPEPTERPVSESSEVTMTVVNCKEWISLRVSPSTSAERIVKIPLGEQVKYISDAENGFCKVSYNGYTGYSLASYLSFN